jgi:hypothetical protein
VRPSFIDGIARVLDIGGNLTPKIKVKYNNNLVM